jgi:hypothetical protein
MTARYPLIGGPEFEPGQIRGCLNGVNGAYKLLDINPIRMMIG